jgi:hypothetical protein
LNNSIIFGLLNSAAYFPVPASQSVGFVCFRPGFKEQLHQVFIAQIHENDQHRLAALAFDIYPGTGFKQNFDHIPVVRPARQSGGTPAPSHALKEVTHRGFFVLTQSVKDSPPKGITVFWYTPGPAAFFPPHALSFRSHPIPGKAPQNTRTTYPPYTIIGKDQPFHQKKISGFGVDPQSMINQCQRVKKGERY